MPSHPDPGGARQYRILAEKDRVTKPGDARRPLRRGRNLPVRSRSVPVAVVLLGADGGRSVADDRRGVLAEASTGQPLREDAHD